MLGATNAVADWKSWPRGIPGHVSGVPDPVIVEAELFARAFETEAGIGK